ncbi:drug/metabolite exporter YedA [Solilutibacter silvestris]|uniref:EamA-like transporter family n=1 Tax=Solilutibacter silvestris TaxID=1645665 RepID=A0A2K1Q034_9GAMM|nr:drug/metabolite exporter YedA [Lysobacter silvestris]PNS08398.1 EamA-like transporter family [Lysobacter silvestris]
MSTHPTAHPPSRTAVVLALAAVYVIWGSTYLAIKLALEGGFTPFWLGAIRFLIAGSIMFVFLRWRGEATPTRKQWANSAVMGLLLLLFGNGFVNYAEQSVSSGLAAVAVASAPIWIALFAWMKGDRATRLEWIGVMIGFIGVIWLNAGSSLRASPAGLIALLIAPLAWSFGSIWSRGRDLPSPFMTSAAQMLCAGVAMSVVALVRGERMPMPTHHAIAAAAYLVVMGSLIGFSAYVWLLHHVRPALAGSYAYVNPVIAVVLGALLVHERFSAGDLIPMAIIVLAVLAMTLGKAARSKSTQAKR